MFGHGLSGGDGEEEESDDAGGGGVVTYSPTRRKRREELCVHCGEIYSRERDYSGYYCEDCRPPDGFYE